MYTLFIIKVATQISSTRYEALMGGITVPLTLLVYRELFYETTQN